MSTFRHRSAAGEQGEEDSDHGRAHCASNGAHSSAVRSDWVFGRDKTLCEAVSALRLRPTAVMQLLSLRTGSLQSRYSRPETSMISGTYKAPHSGTPTNQKSREHFWIQP